MPTFRLGPPQPCLPPAGLAYHSITTLDQRRMFQSLGLGAVVAACVALAWLGCVPGSLPLGQPSFTEFGIVVLVLTLGHEGLHMLGFPRLGCGAGTVAGIWPAGAGSPYVQHLAPMGRNRFLLACLLPFLVLTLLPFALSSHAPGALGYLSWVSLANCLGASSDLYIVAQLLRTVPAGAWVLESGESLLWGTGPYGARQPVSA